MTPFRHAGRTAGTSGDLTEVMEGEGSREADTSITDSEILRSAGRSMRAMVVRTRASFVGSASRVWSLMCNSQMDDTTTLLFQLGVPHPVQCRVVDGRGGVGSERECISDQGVVHQRILEWVPEKRLSFRMERTDMDFQRYVCDIVDTFDLVSTQGTVRVTRTTQLGTRGRFQRWRRIPLFFSMKQVHRYVFRNWQRLARETPASSRIAERSSPIAPVS